MKSHLRIVLVNDLNPFLNPGAAGVAYNFAKELSRLTNEVEFWTTSESEISNEPQLDLTLKVHKVTKSRILRLKKSYKYRLVSEFLNIKSLFWFTRMIRNTRPDVIWLHQIGFMFPKTVVLICRIHRIPTFSTLHDYNLILPRKLYPADLGLNAKAIDFGDINYGDLKKFFLRGGSERRLIKGYYIIRVWCLRFLFNGIQGLFAISNLQAEIYSSFGFNIVATIPNGFYPCTCSSSAKVENGILFAGRDVGKGLDKAIDSVLQAEWHLHLAGDSKLEAIASSRLPQSKYTYHGKLSQEELFALIHRMQFVAVLSQCFDVFPSIAYEALVHGSLPLVTKACGNFSDIYKLSSKLIIPLGQSPKLDEILELSGGIKVHAERLPEILTPDHVTNKYLIYFNN